MKLDTEFIQLPLRFDAARLVEEVGGFSPQEWSAHPTGFKGNAAIRLISAHGGANDDMGGPMLPTQFLDRCPYIKQVLASFQSVFGRSRLMLLAAESVVPPHSDVNYHWFTRVRIHIPVVTYSEVSFHCDDKQVHMRAGDAWIFDNWRTHMVNNPTPHARIHLVADTSGSATFWDMVERGHRPFGKNPDRAFEPEFVPYRAGLKVAIPTEKYNVPDIMSPGEIEWLVGDIMSDLNAPGSAQDADASARFVRVLKQFVSEWRMVWAQCGREPIGWPLYRGLLTHLKDEISKIPATLLLPSNNCRASFALFGRVSAAAINVEQMGDPSAALDADTAANTDYPVDPLLPPPAPAVAAHRRIGRNDPCSCGSGKKYKHCHGVLA
jgi:hypothetical protein